MTAIGDYYSPYRPDPGRCVLKNSGSFINIQDHLGRVADKEDNHNGEEESSSSSITGFLSYLGDYSENENVENCQKDKRNKSHCKEIYKKIVHKKICWVRS